MVWRDSGGCRVAGPTRPYYGVTPATSRGGGPGGGLWQNEMESVLLREVRTKDIERKNNRDYVRDGQS